MSTTIYGYDLLDLTGMRVKAFDLSVEVLRGDYGDGYFDQSLVGSASGLHTFSLTAGVMPDTNLNLPQIESKPWFRYYLDFYLSHVTSTPRFIVTWDTRYWHVRFTDLKLSMDQIRDGLYSTGISLTQIRVPGFTHYVTDGSIDPP